MTLNKSLIKKSDKILIAFSGGKDSIVLLDLLTKSFDKKNIAIAHINHEIRENSYLDAEFSRNIAKKYSIKYFQKNLGLKDIKSNVEAIAREKRYMALNKIAKDNGYTKIATGHTKSDNIEQFFIKLYRGTSLSGLGGILKERDIIIRPLLNLTSDEIKDYVKKNNLTHIEDDSNFENIFLRNKIRNIILPSLDIDNYDLHSHIINLMSQIEKDNIYFEKIINKIIKEDINIFKDFIFFNKTLLLNLPYSIKSRLINLILYKFFNVTTNYNKITEITQELKSKEISKIQISKNINFYIEKSFIAISNDTSSILSLQETQRVFNIIKDEIFFFKNCGPKDLLDNDNALPVSENNIKLVNFTIGDKFQKYNNKSIKLKDIFIDHKIPVFLRKIWPLLSFKDEIIAIPFLEKGYLYNPKNSTLIKNVKK